MTLTVGDVVERLAARTHPDRAAAWDAVGLQVGDPAAPLRTVAVVHEVTEEVTRRVEGEPVDLVVSYHPLLFRPASRLVADRSPAGRATRLLRAGVSVLVTHSDFDAMPGGMSDAMAEALGLTDVIGFSPVEPAEQIKVVTWAPDEAIIGLAEALGDAGAGRIGEYERCSFTMAGTGRFTAGPNTSPAVGQAGAANEAAESRIEMVAPRRRLDAIVAALVAAHPYEEAPFDVFPVLANLPAGGRIGTFAGSWADLVDAVNAQFRPEGLRLAAVDGMAPRRVAVSPGAGDSRIAPAAALGCDVLVSGDISHHRMVEANDRGLSIIDAGHAATERPGIQRLHDLVGELVATDEATIIPNLGRL